MGAVGGWGATGSKAVADELTRREKAGSWDAVKEPKLTRLVDAHITGKDDLSPAAKAKYLTVAQDRFRDPSVMPNHGRHFASAEISRLRGCWPHSRAR